MAFEKIGSINRSRIFQICLEFADESGLEYQILAKSRVLKERVLKEFYAEHPENSLSEQLIFAEWGRFNSFPTTGGPPCRQVYRYWCTPSL
jgi:hypothetical protein